MEAEQEAKQGQTSIRSEDLGYHLLYVQSDRESVRQGV